MYNIVLTGVRRVGLRRVGVVHHGPADGLLNIVLHMLNSCYLYLIAVAYIK